MRGLGVVVCGLLLVAACSSPTAVEPVTTSAETTTSSSTTSTSTPTTTTTSTPTTTTTTAPTTTTTTLHPVTPAVAGSWRARSPNPRVDGWVDLHLTDAGLFRLTNPQADDMTLASGRFAFEDDVVTVFLGLVMWPGCDGNAVFTWELEGEDTLRFAVVDHDCQDIVNALTSHPWHRSG